MLIICYILSLKNKEKFTERCSDCLNRLGKTKPTQHEGKTYTASPCDVGDKLIFGSTILFNMWNHHEKLDNNPSIIKNECPMCNNMDYISIAKQMHDKCCSNTNKPFWCNFGKDCAPLFFDPRLKDRTVWFQHFMPAMQNKSCAQLAKQEYS